MGCYHTKQSPGLRCHQCKGANVNNFLERLCYGCTLEARRPLAKCEEKPYFGEFRCGACTWTWVSRVCWPRCYQKCKHCRRPTYACKWRELTAADRSLTSDQEHEREYCQKCQQVGYYCDFAILRLMKDVVEADLWGLEAGDWRETAQDRAKWRILVSEAMTHFGWVVVPEDCDDKNDETDYEYFPSAVQIWGMFGTILVVGVCWILFSRMKYGLGRLGRLPPPEMTHLRMKRPTTTSRSYTRKER